MKLVGLIGWNGKFNIGDDAMTSVILRYLTQHEFANRFHFLANKNNLAIYLDKELKTEIRGFPFYSLLNKIPVIRFFSRHYIFPYLFSDNKDLLLFGGGSMIHSATLSKRAVRIINWVRKKNPHVLVGAIGVSVGPFKNSNEKIAAKAALEAMDFLVVRDSRSYELVKTMELSKPFKCAPDLALLLPSLQKKFFFKTEKIGKYVGLSLRSGYVTNEKKFWLSELMQEILNRNPAYKLKLFNFSILKGQDDRIENDAFIRALPTALHQRISTINYSRDPFDFYKEIYSCDVMLCMRLHASIISYSVDTKFLMLAYHQKCLDFAEEIGLPSEYLLNEHIPVSRAVLIAEKLLNNCSAGLSKPREEILKQAEEQFYFIHNTSN
jgi:polysaccharide pyruvyl transferase WcaK-like protein